MLEMRVVLGIPSFAAALVRPPTTKLVFLSVPAM